MREFKFRAWAEKTINHKYDYAHRKTSEKYDSIEPSKNSLEWDTWYDKKQEYLNLMLIEWNKLNEENFTKIHEMITDFKINGSLQTPYGYKILDVMQYTGLKDKNKKDIYEGDIVSLSGCKYDTATIVWFDGGYELRINNNEVAWRLDFNTIRNHNVKVIGNVYENPELLNQRE